MPGCSGSVVATFSRMELVGEGLVAMQRRLIQCERVENRRLRIIRIFLRQPFHRFFVSEPPLRLIDLVIVPVVEIDRGEPIALAIRLGTDRLALVHGFQAVLQGGGG
jgi:hypothetical protein